MFVSDNHITVGAVNISILMILYRQSKTNKNSGNISESVDSNL